MKLWFVPQVFRTTGETQQLLDMRQQDEDVYRGFLVSERLVNLSVCLPLSLSLSLSLCRRAVTLAGTWLVTLNCTDHVRVVLALCC